MNITFHHFGVSTSNLHPWTNADSLKRDRQDCVALLIQLTSKKKKSDADCVYGVWEGNGFYVLRDWDKVEFGAGKIIGMAAMGVIDKPTGSIAYIHDVVVSADYRGKGLGEMLMNALIEKAYDDCAEEIELTSHPSRVAANKLYLKLGFKLRETNLYRLELKRP